MKKKLSIIPVFAAAFFWCATCTCGNKVSDNGKPAAPAPGHEKHVVKPGSSFNDTLFVKGPAAVFFSPDSLQLLKIKAALDTVVYKAIMHDYFYQLNYSHKTISKQWPALPVVEATNCRYLSFTGAKGIKQYVDLDKTGDFYGLYVFNGKKKPLPVDMTNIETQVSFYLK